MKESDRRKKIGLRKWLTKNGTQINTNTIIQTKDGMTTFNESDYNTMRLMNQQGQVQQVQQAQPQQDQSQQQQFEQVQEQQQQILETQQEQKPEQPEQQQQQQQKKQLHPSFNNLNPNLSNQFPNQNLLQNQNIDRNTIGRLGNNNKPNNQNLGIYGRIRSTLYLPEKPPGTDGALI
eukprot:Anaeramoba_flamelloidesc36232_g1_i2.p1 GENE.c36232_g1_i2~~c36232_g1_i2.p1  ORF type:complete len:194 (-),score=60.82 c36232_g1_i2:123-653(-)